jgi:hypothetical protein
LVINKGVGFINKTGGLVIEKINPSLCVVKVANGLHELTIQFKHSPSTYPVSYPQKLELFMINMSLKLKRICT